MRSKGFTPVIDKIKDDVGRTPALVYGVMYRFSKMSDLRLCTASQKKIAEVAGVSRDTVIKAQTALLDKGYIHKSGFTKGGTVIWACNVEITGEIVMSVDLSEKTTGGVAKSDTPTNKREEYKKDKTKDLVDGIIDYSKAKHNLLDNVRWFPPDVGSYLEAFSLLFKARYKREATKQERGYWIKECREWKERGYKPTSVTRAWEYATEQGTVIKSPRSITYAFDQLSVKDDEFFAKEI